MTNWLFDYITPVLYSVDYLVYWP